VLGLAHILIFFVIELQAYVAYIYTSIWKTLGRLGVVVGFKTSDLLLCEKFLCSLHRKPWKVN